VIFEIETDTTQNSFFRNVLKTILLYGCLEILLFSLLRHASVDLDGYARQTNFNSYLTTIQIDFCNRLSQTLFFINLPSSIARRSRTFLTSPRRSSCLIKIQSDLHHQQIHRQISFVVQAAGKEITINIKEADLVFPYEMTYSSRFVSSRSLGDVKCCL
jgi:hypothetical protein